MTPEATSPDEIKTITEWEHEFNMQLVGDINPEQRVTHSDFDHLVSERGAVSVMFADRENWLRQYGHELTRENMVDSSLSVPEVTAESEAQAQKPRLQ